MDEQNVADPKLDPQLGEELLLKMYSNMVTSRLLDERGMMLNAKRRIGFYVPAMTGQEAISTGTAAALKSSDWVFPSFANPECSCTGERTCSK
ncbi:MAG: hypothetical protein H6617_01805 [Bdellovibrionaceae bacterium]|nr:hypothetical protein [Pseudobdellovibrionaceae bacterium]